MSDLPRKLEPEVMDSEEDASDYDAMDHSAVNARFCDDLLGFGPSLGHVLDAGTGTGLVAIELARRSPGARIEAIDLANHMVERAKVNVERAGMMARIRVTRADAKSTRLPSGAFEAVMSNSLVHHIPDPREVFAEMWRLVAPGGLLFVRDLARPADRAQVERLADQYAPRADPGAREAHRQDAEPQMQVARQRSLFVASLHAALTEREVREVIRALDIPESAARMTSDRHWTVAHVRR